MAKRTCIVCGYQCLDLVKPFGILTESVPAHHHHSDKQIQDAWMTQNEREHWELEEPLSIEGD